MINRPYNYKGPISGWEEHFTKYVSAKVNRKLESAANEPQFSNISNFLRNILTISLWNLAYTPEINQRTRQILEEKNYPINKQVEERLLEYGKLLERKKERLRQVKTSEIIILIFSPVKRRS